MKASQGLRLAAILIGSPFVACDRRTPPKPTSAPAELAAPVSAARESNPRGKENDAEPEPPKNLDEAVARIVAGLTEEERNFIRDAGEDYAGAVHFGSGMGIRNSWGLWGDSPLSRSFLRMGIYHADDMSAIINSVVSRKVRGVPVKLDELVKYYRDYWAEQDVVSPLDFTCPLCGKEMALGYEATGFSKKYPERYYFSGTCSEGHRSYYYHKDGWRKESEFER